MHYKLLLTIVLVFPFLSPRPVLACSCAPPPPPAEALEASSAVFTGKAVRMERVATNGLGEEVPVRVTFRVDRSWKGVSKRTFTVGTWASSASCGYDFEVGEEYLVYADDFRGQVVTHLCARTRPLIDAHEDLTALGPAADTRPRSRCGGLDNFAALQAALFILLGVALGGRRHASSSRNA